MAKPNYQFDKRQRDIAKKKQQDEKRLKKRAKNGDAKASDAPAEAAAQAQDPQPPQGS
jgi:hypothetical protein